jgi:hypothetical protein
LSSTPSRTRPPRARGAGTYRTFVGRQRPQGATIAFALNFEDDPSPLIFPVVKTLAATHR